MTVRNSSPTLRRVAVEAQQLAIEGEADDTVEITIKPALGGWVILRDGVPSAVIRFDADGTNGLAWVGPCKDGQVVYTKPCRLAAAAAATARMAQPSPVA